MQSRAAAASFAVATAVLGEGCRTYECQAQLSQDPRIHWMETALATDATALYRQPFGTVPNVDARYTNLEEDCVEAGFASAANGLAALHNDLVEPHAKLGPSVPWLQTPTKSEAMEIALVDRAISLGAEGGVRAFEPIKLEASASYEDRAVGMIVARVAYKLQLSDHARRCVLANMCRTRGKGTDVQFVAGVYYGNLVRLQTRMRQASFRGAATGVEPVSASFSVRASDVSIVGAILGRTGGAEGAQPFDVPTILSDLEAKNLSHTQNALVELAKSHDVIAVRLEGSTCE